MKCIINADGKHFWDKWKLTLQPATKRYLTPENICALHWSKSVHVAVTSLNTKKSSDFVAHVHLFSFFPGRFWTDNDNGFHSWKMFSFCEQWSALDCARCQADQRCFRGAGEHLADGLFSSAVVRSGSWCRPIFFCKNLIEIICDFFSKKTKMWKSVILFQILTTCSHLRDYSCNEQKQKRIGGGERLWQTLGPHILCGSWPRCQKLFYNLLSVTSMLVCGWQSRSYY